jgi:ethanolamine utilization protein EutN
MILGKVIGNVVATIKLKIYEGYKILIIQPIHPEGRATGKPFLAIDTVQAGPGDIVLVIDEGNSARLIINDTMAPVRSVVAAVVDEISLKGVDH